MFSSGFAVVIELAELVNVEAVVAVVADVVHDALHNERLVLNLRQGQLAWNEVSFSNKRIVTDFVSTAHILKPISY